MPANQNCISSQINLLNNQNSHRILTTTTSHNNSECSNKKLSKAKDLIKVRISDIT